ncbi:hypothetical protein [Xanthomonas fragariae]|uniref:hypothetical protein n=1 Tax=Xanthomonas fragariae TaxID=48664 RepID=UPI001ABE9EDF|nr:hypothetical protein [Xanthomonas fragariae]UKR51951.1 hypothetical protein K4A87_14785 [Xanthomonas fragariae]
MSEDVPATLQPASERRKRAWQCTFHREGALPVPLLPASDGLASLDADEQAIKRATEQGRWRAAFHQNLKFNWA